MALAMTSVLASIVGTDGSKSPSKHDLGGALKPYFLGVEARGPAAIFLRQFLKVPGRYHPEPPFDIPDQVYALALGSDAARASTNIRDFTEGVGMVWNNPLSDALVYVTYHPLYVQKKPSLLPEFKNHCSVFATMSKL